MWRVAVAGALVSACSVSAPTPEPAADSSASHRPGDTFEPDSGSGRAEARVVVDGDDVWFVYTRTPEPDLFEDELWVTKTTPAGARLAGPERLDTIGPGGAGSLVRVGDRVIVAYQHYADYEGPRRREISAVDGLPYASDQEVPITDNGPAWRLQDERILASATGELHVVASYAGANGNGHELAVVPLNAAGTSADPPTLVGTRAETSPVQVAAIVEPDGGIVLAWTRMWPVDIDALASPRPHDLVTTRIDPAGIVAPIQQVADRPDLSEDTPVLGADGTTTYVAWRAEEAGGGAVAIARVPDVAAAVSSVGTGVAYGRLGLALAAPGRGAVAWTSASGVSVAAFADDGSAIRFGTPTTEALADPSVTPVVRLWDFVHVADDRYVVAWSESAGERNRQHLYAKEVTLP